MTVTQEMCRDIVIVWLNIPSTAFMLFPFILSNTAIKVWRPSPGEQISNHLSSAAPHRRGLAALESHLVAHFVGIPV